MPRLASIVVGVDFSPGSTSALREALRLAGRDGASLHAVHFLDTVAVVATESALSDFQRDIRAGLVAGAKRRWTEFRAAVPEAASLEIEVTIDNALRAMTRSLLAAKADLLVVGACGAGETAGGPGTFAAACVRTAPSPVLLVPPRRIGPFRRVLACVDFSETARAALVAAADLARADGASLDVLHVFPAPWVPLHERAPSPAETPQFRRQFTDALRRRLETTVAETLGSERAARATLHLVDSQRPGRAIADHAASTGADLLAIGTRGESTLRDLLLGSTAERVLRDCVGHDRDIAILAVKPRSFASSIADPA